MGAIAEAMVAYAKPLLDETDGSPEQVSKAIGLAQICWNLALLPEEQRDKCLADLEQCLESDFKQAKALRHSVIVPMIRRHHEMFPLLQRKGSTQQPRRIPPAQVSPAATSHSKQTAAIGRNSPCRCNSGKKYKHCCGR